MFLFVLSLGISALGQGTFNFIAPVEILRNNSSSLAITNVNPDLLINFFASGEVSVDPVVPVGTVNVEIHAWQSGVTWSGNGSTANSAFGFGNILSPESFPPTPFDLWKANLLVPEPSSVSLFLIGILVLGGRSGKRFVSGRV